MTAVGLYPRKSLEKSLVKAFHLLFRNVRDGLEQTLEHVTSRTRSQWVIYNLQEHAVQDSQIYVIQTIGGKNHDARKLFQARQEDAHQSISVERSRSACLEENVRFIHQQHRIPRESRAEELGQLCIQLVGVRAQVGAGNLLSSVGRGLGDDDRTYRIQGSLIVTGESLSGQGFAHSWRAAR